MTKAEQALPNMPSRNWSICLKCSIVKQSPSNPPKLNFLGNNAPSFSDFVFLPQVYLKKKKIYDFQREGPFPAAGLRFSGVFIFQGREGLSPGGSPPRPASAWKGRAEDSLGGKNQIQVQWWNWGESSKYCGTSPGRNNAQSKKRFP